ncbi:fructose-bisphosphate aldolase class I [Alphaproteobacteria bacterium]|nr:fructose-bisphosphate aldolase class I [Alphaproteobacteria bacterium]
MLNNLDITAKEMVKPGKGILAADESTGTIKKRFDSIGVVSTEELRLNYRQMLFEAPQIENYISGVILFDETIRQKTKTGRQLINILEEKNILPGIKVDKGVVPHSEYPDYPVTEGLDGLNQRCEEYRKLGARFTKWRAVIKINQSTTPDAVISANTQALSRYASIAQRFDLVPIVEPEVLMDGNHSIDDCQKITAKTLKSLYDEMDRQNVRFESSILKPNMIISGSESVENSQSKEIAEKTIATLKKFVPAAVPGIAFLSGGQSEKEASLNLNQINSQGVQPWNLTFSYGRALQQSSLSSWKGENSKSLEAQNKFIHRAKMNSKACLGEYDVDMENEK